LRVTEGEEGRGPPAHALHKPLLAYYTVYVIARSGSADEIQGFFRLTPYLVEMVSSRKKIGDGPVAAVTGVGQIAILDSRAERGLDEVECGGDWLGPYSDPSHRHVDLRLVAATPCFSTKSTPSFSKR
jgi:hypothetical protein